MSTIKLDTLLFNNQADADKMAYLLNNSAPIRANKRFSVVATTYGWKIIKETFVKKFGYWY
jgi:hypothetical protein